MRSHLRNKRIEAGGAIWRTFSRSSTSRETNCRTLNSFRDFEFLVFYSSSNEFLITLRCLSSSTVTIKGLRDLPAITKLIRCHCQHKLQCPCRSWCGKLSFFSPAQAFSRPLGHCRCDADLQKRSHIGGGSGGRVPWTS